uniref:Uncharacterized protein n=1 Tax=Panagrolaimus davidi TaxID=227884 RepID=A0A914PF90_9BILA
MFIISIIHRIFGRKSKKVEIAKEEKKLTKLPDNYENFQPIGTPSTSQSNAYELDLKLLKMRHQRNCKNINPRLSALKSIKKSPSRTKVVKSLSAEAQSIQIYPHLKPISLPKIRRVSASKIQRIPTYRFVFRRTRVIRRRKLPCAKDASDIRAADVDAFIDLKSKSINYKFKVISFKEDKLCLKKRKLTVYL